jgi:X-X-X-Leu-X-X-Gly heptad repeat protein
MVSSLLIFASSFPPAAFASEKAGKEAAGKYSAKDEVVYGNLDAAGGVKDMYVVNTFRVTEPGMITDYGNYTNVRNLTDLSELKLNDAKSVQLDADKGEFYYQGELKNEKLPWDISITYLLDGKKMKPEELAGKEGSLEIRLETTASKNADPLFIENYLMQMSLTFDPEKFSDIQAPEGTKANAGKDQQISFTVLPDQEEVFIVTAEGSGMEMDPIEISAIPANLSIDSPDLSDMTGGMNSLADAIQGVHSGVVALNDGISEWRAGAAELGSGSTEYKNGINELNQSSGELVNGSASIRDALNEISGSLQGDIDVPDLSGIEELPEGLRALASGLSESSADFDELKENYGALIGALDEAITSIPDDEIDIGKLDNLDEEQLQALKDSGIDTDMLNQLTETYISVKEAKQTYHAVKEDLNSAAEKLEQTPVPSGDMVGHLETLADEIEKGMDSMDQMNGLIDLQEGLSRLASEYQTFHQGLTAYTGGVSALAGSYGDLDSGIQGLSEGASSLAGGADELENGTAQLQEETNNLPGRMKSEVNEMLREYDFSDFKPASFVSEKNKKIDVVQFVLHTEAIKKEEKEKEAPKKQKEKSLWQRLMDLF